jgi:hypothetical protein
MKIDLNLGDTQLILAECRANGLSRQQTAYILATALWETALTMKPVEEAFWLSEAWRQKNLRYYPWHGRGYVQITWEVNYLRAGKNLDMDLTTDPDSVMNPKVAVKILVRGCMEGWFTGKKLGDYVNKTKKDYVGARRVVNGTDKAEDIEDLAEQYEAEIGDAPAPVAAPSFLAALIAFIVSLFGKAKP